MEWRICLVMTTTAADIDRLSSTEPDHGGNDTITVGDGDDIIIGGEDGEIVNDVIIGELSSDWYAGA